MINFLFKETKVGKKPSGFKRFVQEQLLNVVISWSDVSPAKDKSSSGSSSGFALSEMHPYWGMKAIESISYMSAPARGPFWYGCLQDLKQEFQKAKVVAPTKELKEEYAYRLFTIEKALRK